MAYMPTNVGFMEENGMKHRSRTMGIVVFCGVFVCGCLGTSQQNSVPTGGEDLVLAANGPTVEVVKEGVRVCGEVSLSIINRSGSKLFVGIAGEHPYLQATLEGSPVAGGLRLLRLAGDLRVGPGRPYELLGCV